MVRDLWLLKVRFWKLLWFRKLVFRCSVFVGLDVCLFVLKCRVGVVRLRLFFWVSE